MPDPLIFVVLLAAAVGLWAAYGKLQTLDQPRSWQARRYNRPCDVCEEADAIFHERGMHVCEECSELLP